MSNVATIDKRQSSGFDLQPSSFDEAVRMAEMLACSGMVPKQYTSNPQGTLVAMMMGSELGLNPIQSLQNIAVINGKPSIYGDALVALVQNHPAFGGMEESFDDQTMTATCTVWRRGGAKQSQSFSQQDATTAGLWGKTGPWSQYPKRMLQMRARGFALRDQFADALAGLITVEEARDMPEERDVTPKPEARPEPETYPQDQFDANFPAWEAKIKSGKNNAERLIKIISSKGEMTEQQKQQLRNVKEEGEAE